VAEVHHVRDFQLGGMTVLVHIVDAQLVEKFQLWLANAAVLERQSVVGITPALEPNIVHKNKNNAKGQT